MATTPRTVTGSTTRKVIGSLGVIGTAAAVAGLGTFGGFTDSTTPVSTTVTTGTLSINATGPATTAVNVTGMVPGDSITRALDIKNDGTLPLGSVAFATTAPSSVLTTDTVNGLQLSLKKCSVAWSASNTCAGTQTSVYNGPVLTSQTMSNPASLAVNGTDYLLYTVSLPNSADNTFQGKTAALSLTFTATQATGSAR
jgi:Camelysin metallo-endopeptidase